MKFTRFLKFRKCEITPAHLKRSERALRKQQLSAPLFAEEIASTQPTPEERLKGIHKERSEFWQGLRDGRARQWRESRRILWHIDAQTAIEIKLIWALEIFPLSSEYFADLICSKLGPEKYLRLRETIRKNQSI
jgi:hypothetical protein